MARARKHFRHVRLSRARTLHALRMQWLPRPAVVHSRASARKRLPAAGAGPGRAIRSRGRSVSARLHSASRKGHRCGLPTDHALLSRRDSRGRYARTPLLSPVVVKATFAMSPSVASESIPVLKPNYLEAGQTIRSWLLTRDHKRIGLLYLFSITFFFSIAAVAAALMRIALLSPKGDL